jgi:hypothetical protein
MKSKRNRQQFEQTHGDNPSTLETGIGKISAKDVIKQRNQNMGTYKVTYLDNPAQTHPKEEKKSKPTAQK